MNGHSSKFGVTNEPLAAYPNHWFKANPRKSAHNAKLTHVAPIRHCSWWGLPCGPCYHQPGGLLPHLFTLAQAIDLGGFFSVALSVGLPRPGVTRHRRFVESGLSSKLNYPATTQSPAYLLRLIASHNFVNIY